MYVAVILTVFVVSVCVQDTALFAELTRKTGGSLHLLTGSLLDEMAVFLFQQELNYTLGAVVGSEAVLKLRCSAGFRPEDYVGAGRMAETSTEAELASIDSDFSFLYTFSHDGSPLKDEEPVYLQVAVLYTSVFRKRLVRVHNMQLTASSAPAQVFRNVDLDCVVSMLFKRAIDKVRLFP